MADRFSMAQKLRVSLIATWVGLAAFVWLSVYVVAEAVGESASDNQGVIGIAVLFGGFLLVGIGMAALHTRTLVRLLRQSESDKK
jgi:hypothetical protein